MESDARLVISGPHGNERTVALAEADLTVGRATANDIVLSDARASRAHARLTYTNSQWTLVDLGSSAGTFVNGDPMPDQVVLRPGDVIRMGDSVLRFETGTASTDTAPEDVGPAVIDTPADLEATLAGATVPVQLNNIGVARLAVWTPTATWEVLLVQDGLTIGRQSDSDVIVNLARVSRQHAAIERRGDEFWLRDLGSTNGTYLAGRRVEEQQLVNGDTIRIGDAQLVFKQATSPEDLTLIDAGAGFRSAVDASGRDARRPRQPVVFVPGLMGSELWLGSERIWPNVRLLFTQPELFLLPEKVHLEPRSIVGDVVIVPKFVEQEQYSRAGDFLEEALGYRRGRDLLEFAYDWRQDVRQSAQRLAEAIDAWPVDPPITIIAHSLGTLVSRYYVERLGGKHKVGRILLIGGPHLGTPRIATDLVQGVGLLPFGLFGDRLLDVIKTFPSVYQILPTYPCAVDQHGKAIDLLSDERWLPADQAPLLRQAREFRADLGTRSSVPAVSIFGYGLETVTDIQATRDPEGRWSKLVYRQKPSGDNRVPEHSAILEGSDVHPVQQGHGSLYVDNDVKARLKVELLR